MCTAVKKIEENAKGKMTPGRIVVSNEQGFDAISSGTKGIIIWARRRLGHMPSEV